MELPAPPGRRRFAPPLKTLHMRTIIYISLILVHLLIAAISRGQADTVRPGKGLLLTSTLKPGLRQYLVFRRLLLHHHRPAERLIGHFE